MERSQFNCEQCVLQCLQALNNQQTHNRQLLDRIAILEKMESLHKNLARQRTELTSSILYLKKQEFEEFLTCSCIGFCVITHTKHNFYKSKADKVCAKLKSLSTSSNIHIENPHDHLGAYSKYFTCNTCEVKFRRQRDLKKHNKSDHKEARGKMEKYLDI